jgi:hypothetical protein
MSWADSNPPIFWEFALLKVDALGMMAGWVYIAYRKGSLGYNDPREFAAHVLNRDTFHVMGVRTCDPQRRTI